MPPQTIRALNASASCVNGVRKIAVLRANAIGDFIFCLPALDALRAAYPAAEITLLGQPWHAAFLSGRPGPIDRVEVIPPIPGVGEPEDAEHDEAAEAAFFWRMRAEEFDLAVQLHGGGRNSNPVVRQLGAQVTIGAVTPDAPPLDRSVSYTRWQSEIARMLEIAALAGAEPVTLTPNVQTIDRDHSEADLLDLPASRPILALNPGASDAERRWPPERFAAVGDAAAAAGATVVITGAGFDAPLANAIRATMRGQAFDTTGRLSLGGLAALFERCAVVVSNDTGPLHLAMAVGAATVGLYWCFNYITAAPLAMNRHRSVISWRTACPICGIDRATASCDDHPSFLADLPAEAAIQPMLDLLASA
jgi:ADP-heptose:LPS heptosyltransferase